MSCLNHGDLLQQKVANAYIPGRQLQFNVYVKETLRVDQTTKDRKLEATSYKCLVTLGSSSSLVGRSFSWIFKFSYHIRLFHPLEVRKET